MAPGSTVNYDVKERILTLSMEDENIQSLYDRWDSFRRASSRGIESTLSLIYEKLRQQARQNQAEVRYVDPLPAPPAVPVDVGPYGAPPARLNYDGQPVNVVPAQGRLMGQYVERNGRIVWEPNE